MKILQVVHGFPPKQRSGTEIYTYMLSKALRNENHEVHVFYPMRGNKFKVETIEREGLILHELKIPVIHLIMGVFDFENTYLNKKIESIFRELLTELNPDIVHFQHVIGLSSSLIEISKKLGYPTVLTLHDYWFICPNIQLLNYRYEICEEPTPSKCKVCWIKMKADSLASYGIPKFLSELALKIVNPERKFKLRIDYMRRLLSIPDLLIAPSKFLRNVFISCGVPENKIIYSENGYDLSLFEGFEKEKNTDKIVFGFVGGINRHKGVHILIDAFMKVPEDKAELRIYGGCNPKSKFVREILEKIKNKNNIKLMGRFNDVKKPYSEIDVLIVPSIWHETGGPLVVREALATKIPVIASRVGSIPELITDNLNGLLFEPNNPEDLYNKIMKIVQNSELIDEFKSNIKPPRSIEDQVKEIEQIYEKLLGGLTNA